MTEDTLFTLMLLTATFFVGIIGLGNLFKIFLSMFILITFFLITFAGFFGGPVCGILWMMFLYSVGFFRSALAK